MKNDNEFLKDMWNDISLLEHEELQKQIARQKTIKQIKENTIIYLSTVFAFVLLITITIFNNSDIIKNIILSLSLSLFVIVYLFENSLQNKIILIKGILILWIQ